MANATSNDRLYLASDWFLRSAENLADSGEEISSPAYLPEDWMPAQVPGTVLNSYVKNGRFPEPYYGVNNKLSRDERENLTKGLIPDASVPGSVFTFPHWFRTTFTLTPAYQARLIWLNLNGINWKAEVFLNGRSVGEMVGAFKRGIFHVTDKAVLGKNIVAVKVHPLLNPGIPHVVPHRAANL